MNERVCVERRRERDREMFQFVSLVLSSVCLSWRRVMSDSHAAWHCAGRRRTKSRPTWGKNEVRGKDWNYLEEFWGCSERFMSVKVMFSQCELRNLYSDSTHLPQRLLRIYQIIKESDGSTTHTWVQNIQSLWANERMHLNSFREISGRIRVTN